MTNRVLPAFSAISLAAAAACCALPAHATGLSFEGPVSGPPAGCSFRLGAIYDTVPKSRPSAIPIDPAAVTAAVSVNAVGRRMVAYAYAFSSMDSRVPPNFAGTFSVYATRVSTYEGSWDVGYPLASVKTFLNSATTSAVTFNYSAGAWEYPTFNDVWFVKVEVQGYQQATPGAPLVARTFTFNCPVTVQPLYTPPPPVFTR